MSHQKVLEVLMGGHKWARQEWKPSRPPTWQCPALREPLETPKKAAHTSLQAKSHPTQPYADTSLW